MAATAALTMLAGKPRADTPGPGIFRQAVANSFIVYGKRRVGGLLIFFHPRTVGKDQYRYFVIAVAGHQCKGVTRWFLGDEQVTVDGSGKVTSGKYLAAVYPALDAQASSANIFIGWASTQSADGTYPPAEPPPGGWGGDGRQPQLPSPSES